MVPHIFSDADDGIGMPNKIFGNMFVCVALAIRIYKFPNRGKKERAVTDSYYLVIIWKIFGEYLSNTTPNLKIAARDYSITIW